MPKLECARCGNKKGNRKCARFSGQSICPQCCVAIRNDECQNCDFYIQSLKQKVERYKTTGKHPFQLDSVYTNEIETILIRMGATRNTQLAEKELEKYSEPTSHEYYYAKGTICLMKKEYKEAIPYFERALRIFPFFQQAWLNLGCALIKTISISNAYDALQIALLLSEPGKNTYDVAKENLDDLEDSIRHVNNVSLDVFIKRMKKFEKHFREMKTDTAAAARGFEELLTEDPNHVQTHGNLGLCYAMLGRKADAEKELKKALELDPEYTVASHNLQLLDNVTEGQSINSIPDCQQIEIDFYKDLFTMQNSKNTSETKIIRELYRLCGLLQE